MPSRVRSCIAYVCAIQIALATSVCYNAACRGLASVHADEAARDAAARCRSRAARACWLYDFDGRRYLDAVSSWWVNLFGHANPRINAALTDQLGKLEHVMLAGFTHEPVVELSERLSCADRRRARPLLLRQRRRLGDRDRAQDELSLLAQPRAAARKRGFVSLAGSYHGETLGALSVTDVAAVPRHLRAAAATRACRSRARTGGWPKPANRCRRGTAGALARWKRTWREHHAQTAALIVEPLVQGATGMAMYDAALPAPRARTVRPLSGASHRRRDHAGLRPHRHLLRATSRRASGRISCACPRASPAATCRCRSC